MRQFLAGLSLLPALALLVACSGASKMTDSVVSAADPKAALAASSEVMSKESYYLEYKIDFPDDLEGTYVMARRGEEFAIRIDTGKDGQFSVFDLDGKSYWCIGTDEGLGSFFGDEEEACLDFSAMEDLEGDESTGSDDEYESIEGLFDDLLFDPVSMILESYDDDDVTIDDAADRKVNGEDGRCFDITSPDTEAVVCVSRESGVLFLIDGEMEGEDGLMELVDSRDPRDSDFELPYEVSDFDFGDVVGGLGEDFENPEPKQPKNPGIDAVRIAGEPYPWESGAPLCPNIDLTDDWAVLDIEPLPGGAFALGEKQFDADCAESVLEDPYNVRTIDGEGNLYVSEYTGQIVRVAPDGTRTPIAGSDCGFGCAYSEESRTEGPALEVEIFGLTAIAVSDGTVWFAADDHTTDEMDYQIRRVTDDGRVETVDVPERDEVDNWISDLLPGPDGTLYVVYWDAVFHRKADGTYVEVEDIGDSCHTASADGTLWSADWMENELIALLPNGKRETFLFEPDTSFDFSCTDLVVDSNGDLLFLSASFGGYPGLWRIPNPLH